MTKTLLELRNLTNTLRARQSKDEAKKTLKKKEKKLLPLGNAR
jgi:hypothetical protein